MKKVKEIRQDRADDMSVFNELRKDFAEISARYSSQKLNSSLRSSIGNRVTFKKDITTRNATNSQHHQQSSQQQQHHQQRQQQQQQPLAHQNPNTSLTQQERSEETDDDVSLSNALESNEEDTEPTKSLVSESRVQASRAKDLASPRKAPKTSGTMNPDEISDLESISQLLSDRSASRKKERIVSSSASAAKASSNVNDMKRKIEKQNEQNAKKNTRPTPNAVPIGFFNERVT
jgi:hypothetical protein